MAPSNKDRVTKAFDLLSEGLLDIVDEVMTSVFKSSEWPDLWAAKDAQKFGTPKRKLTKQDVQVQLRALTEFGKDFDHVLSRGQKAFATELRDARNAWAHNEPISSDDAMRALDTAERLLSAVGSVDSAEDVKKLRLDLQRTVFEEQTRQKIKRTKVTLDPGTAMKPWREIITPHEDIIRGEFTASEFAADLHLVHAGQALSKEYSDPVEFFKRTYLTEGLSDLLGRAVKRMAGDMSASPVVNLQTNFGGGKTHSMLAVYHLFSGVAAESFPQEVQELLADAGGVALQGLGVKRAALVGTYLQADSPLVKDDGTEVRTLWGELAWQLGGKKAYEIVADADRSGTNPGAALRTLLEQHSPALILIDEWVAYARQLVTEKSLAAGSFETQFTFAQSLTEIVQSVPGAMLVLSIPASDTAQDGQGNDIEVGGANGQAALERLQNVVRRVADQWRPSSKDESFEIIKRRLFKEVDAQGLAAIAAVARTFVMMYRENKANFPSDASVPGDDYENRIKASYPLHPELLDRLYEDWSTLERFQRTRGALKLVSSIIHELWASNDRSPLVLPGNVPLDATSVNTDLTQYLQDQWKPIIDSDIDGQSSTAVNIDLERANLGQRFITERIARTIFFGAAPRLAGTRKGLDKQGVWLGTAVPGDPLGNFTVAIELLAQRSTYFYEDQGHYWFDTKPSVTKTANDYAERLREDEETVWNEICRRLQSEEKQRGLFDRVHSCVSSSGEIPDLEETRLVIVHPRYAWRKQDGNDSPALAWVKDALEKKGATNRIFRNSLIFLVAEKANLENLEAGVRDFLAWKKIESSKDSMNLSTQQVKQTEDRIRSLEGVVSERIAQTFIWAVYPEQIDPSKPFELSTDRIGDGRAEGIADRVSKKLARDEQLITELGPPILGSTINKDLSVMWSDSGEITVGALWDLFVRHPYLPRLVNRQVLDDSIKKSLKTAFLEEERFAIALSTDKLTGKYSGLVLPPDQDASLQVTDSTILVRWDLAEAQHKEQQASAGESSAVPPSPNLVGSEQPGSGAPSITSVVSNESDQQVLPKRYFGRLNISSALYSKELTGVMREVLDRLVASGAKLEISIEIQAEKSEGFTDSEVRVVAENSKVLGFDNQTGFERE
jgi:predicted AAA+ superfamily ATPase